MPLTKELSAARLIRDVGRLLYGERWQSALAAALHIKLRTNTALGGGSAAGARSDYRAIARSGAGADRGTQEFALMDAAMIRPTIILTVALAVLPAFAGEHGPDPTLTPGAVAETRTAVICAPGYARTHRVWHGKTGTLAKYGIPETEAAKYEDDDLVPVCLGGDNASPLNHWPELRSAVPGAADKDALERRICYAPQLAGYQAAFAKDWLALWRQAP
jgi:hypothetical protein